ncbi:hypothetical protein BD410DRAFT_830449 [Rickenella mellea]|uniref:Zn(2)-C6 fungal-type domain-containing protein n=1 Tax=Rickenella mellea TaxID=50990 RepID=A0A4Y7PW91_9AGAM|nr:hypothetical protein BD410DRAFT_830449 [Rickenella mellea]
MSMKHSSAVEATQSDVPEAAGNPAHVTSSRRQIVCNECKRLKVRCDLREPCEPCTRRKVGHLCLYNVKDNLSLKSLHNRVSDLEATLAKIRPVECRCPIILSQERCNLLPASSSSSSASKHSLSHLLSPMTVIQQPAETAVPLMNELHCGRIISPSANTKGDFGVVDTGGISHHQPYHGHNFLHLNHATSGNAGKRRREVDRDSDADDVDLEDRNEGSESSGPSRHLNKVTAKKKKSSTAVLGGSCILSKRRCLVDLDSPEGRTNFIVQSIQYLYTVTHEQTEEIFIQDLIAYLNAAMPMGKHEDFDAAEVSHVVSAFVRSSQIDHYYDDDYALNFLLQFDGQVVKSV